MPGCLQAKIQGVHRHSSTLTKSMGKYNNPPLKRMGHYNGAVKQMGQYNGTGSSKSNIISEIYPHY